MSPTPQHQGRSVQAPRAGSRNRRFALLCLLALILQVTLPGVHAWYATLEDTAAARHLLAGTLMVGAGSPSVLRARVDPAPRHWHHDPALCQVCQTLTQARHYILTPARAIAIASRRAQCLTPAVSYHCSPHTSAASPRAPPVVS